MNPEIQPTSPLELAGVAVATPASGLVKMKVLVCLGVVLICLAAFFCRDPEIKTQDFFPGMLREISKCGTEIGAPVFNGQ